MRLSTQCFTMFSDQKCITSSMSQFDRAVGREKCKIPKRGVLTTWLDRSRHSEMKIIGGKILRALRR